MLVGGRAATQQPEGLAARVPELVPLAGQDRYGITGLDLADLPFDADSAPAMGDVVNLFRLRVIMLFRARADGYAGLRQALIADGRVPMRRIPGRCTGDRR